MSAENSELKSPRQPLDAWFLELLACPACTQHLPLQMNDAQDALMCGCGRYAFPVRDGLPILIVEEATLLDESKHPEDVKGDGNQ